jgi:hypothetical protein
MVDLTKVFRPIAGCCTALGILLVASSVLADSSVDPTSAPLVDPNAGFNSPEGGGGLFDDASGPMDLIHRAVLMNDMSLSDFRQQQGNHLTREAANFRQLQQEALQRQITPNVADGVEASVLEEE